MLYGSFRHNIDKKGRLAIPSKMRDDLGSSFMICRSILGEGCLCAYSLPEWAKLVEELGKLPKAKSSNIKRYFFEGAFNVELDTQGRILLPAMLRDEADLTGEAYIIGMDSNIEIWKPERWEEKRKQYTPESIFADVAELDF